MEIPNIYVNTQLGYLFTIYIMLQYILCCLDNFVKTLPKIYHSQIFLRNNICKNACKHTHNQ